MEDKYIYKVNTVCKSCGYRNIIDITSQEKADVIACGHCGNYIYSSLEVKEKDKKEINKIISEAIKE